MEALQTKFMDAKNECAALTETLDRARLETSDLRKELAVKQAQSASSTLEQDRQLAERLKEDLEKALQDARQLETSLRREVKYSFFEVTYL